MKKFFLILVIFFYIIKKIISSNIEIKKPEKADILIFGKPIFLKRKILIILKGIK